MTNSRIATFDKEDWQKILDAMNYFIRCQQEELSKRNVGDKEWQELMEYEAIATDILLYVIGNDSK
tara:strand:- start:443 stop:640 length:198 start_codon:yes stop_codon:yes gene_type:complete